MDYLNYINEHYPIRRSKKQKKNFQEYVINECSKLGATAKVEIANKKHENIVIGDMKNAKVFFTAHYDTPAGSLFPNLMLPRNSLLFYIYQFSYPLLLALVSLLIAFGIGTLFSLDNIAIAIIYVIFYFGIFYLLTRCFPNKHNLNDNTSGVSVIMSMIENNNLKDVCYILFDNEEKGLLGSKAIVKEKGQLFENKLVINLDCVGNGKTMIFIAKEGATSLKEYQVLYDTFMSDVHFNIRFYPYKGSHSNSDYKNFKCGIGVMACKKRDGVGYYTPRIHTYFDTVSSTGNILYLVSEFEKFLSLI